MSELVARIQRELTRPQRSRAQTWTRRVIMSVLLIVTPVLAVEVALRAVGFHRPQIPMQVQTQTSLAAVGALNERFETSAFVPDRFLLWRHQPGENFGGLEVTLLGTLGPSAGVHKEGIRVLCLGESTTAMQYRTYPHIAQRLIDSGSTRSIEIINAAVAGYTTEQGLRWLQQLRELEPDYVLFSFGWNDHFPALNLPDRELGARSGLVALLQQWFYRSRVFQYVTAPSDTRTIDRTTTDTLRVPPEEFAENLNKLVAAARAVDARPVLVTQPFHLNSDSEQHFLNARFRFNGHKLSDLHQQYNRIVRDVAAQSRCALLDVDEEFRRRDTATLFDDDGMHLSPSGHNIVARLLVALLRNEEMISPREFENIVKFARYDTTAPDKPHAAWVLSPSELQTTASTPTRVAVRVKNTGNSTWLSRHVVERLGRRRNVPYGTASIQGTWKTAGAETTTPAAIVKLGHDLLPGESTSTTLEFKAPPVSGEFAMEVGVHVAEIGDLKNYGAEVTTLTVQVLPPG